MKMLMCVKGNFIGSQSWINMYRKLLISGRKGIVLLPWRSPFIGCGKQSGQPKNHIHTKSKIRLNMLYL